MSIYNHHNQHKSCIHWAAGGFLWCLLTSYEFWQDYTISYHVVYNVYKNTYSLYIYSIYIHIHCIYTNHITWWQFHIVKFHHPPTALPFCSGWCVQSKPCCWYRFSNSHFTPQLLSIPLDLQVKAAVFHPLYWLWVGGKIKAATPWAKMAGVASFPPTLQITTNCPAWKLRMLLFHFTTISQSGDIPPPTHSTSFL